MVEMPGTAMVRYPDEQEATMTDLMKWFESRRSPMDVIERLFEGDVGSSAIRVEEMVDGNTPWCAPNCPASIRKRTST